MADASAHIQTDVAQARPMQPLVSVVVPIYNVEKYLDACLLSLRAQSYQPLEIICINDGSTDGSLTLLKKHAAEDVRVRIIDKANQGYGAACNSGIAAASGEFISIIEPDDWVEADMYAQMIGFWREHAAREAQEATTNPAANDRAEGSAAPHIIDIIKTPYYRIVDVGDDRERKMNCSYKRRVKPSRQPFTIDEAPLLLRHHPSIWSALYSKQFLSEFGIKFREYPGAGWADNPFLVETLCQARTILYLDEPFYCYREDTPAKSQNFYRNNPLMPLQRWHEGKDIMDRLHVSDADVLEAHNQRGFVYMGDLFEVVCQDYPGLLAQVDEMFERMLPEHVFEDPQISPANKRLFVERRGLPVQRVGSFAYYNNLLSRGLYSLGNIGVKNTLATTFRFLKKRDSRK